MKGRLSGKNAVVLGAARRGDIGQVIAKRFREEGAQVAIAGRHSDELQRFAAEIGGVALRCDITKSEDVATLATHATDSIGTISIAVNATGQRSETPYLTATRADLDRLTSLQFVEPYQFFQAMIPMMIDGGSLIQISSAAATIMLNDCSVYMGTKAGFDHVIRCIANEFGDRGIRANSLSPGLTDMPLNADAKKIPGLFDAFVKSYPLGRMGTSSDIAAAAVWLASDECFMTGQNLQVNGGLALRRNSTNDEIGAAIATASS